MLRLGRKLALLRAVMLVSVLRSASGEVCTSAVCTYDFTVEWARTMTYYHPNGQEAFNVVPEGDQLKIVPNLYTTESPLLGTTVDPYSVHTGDGFPRNAILINGQSPGPMIEVMEGVEVEVRVTNKMMEEITSIHFHGMRQMSNNIMDGVPYFNQCPILPGQTFTYRFKAEPSGAHFYHSHVGGQRVDGLHGMLLVHSSYPTMTNFPLVVADWDHVDSRNLWITSPFNNHKVGSGEREDVRLTANNDLGLGEVSQVVEPAVDADVVDDHDEMDAAGIPMRPDDGGTAPASRDKRQAVRPEDEGTEPTEDREDADDPATQPPADDQQQQQQQQDGEEAARGDAPEDEEAREGGGFNPYGPEYDLLYTAFSLINGRGRHDPQVKLPLTMYRVTQGNTYRFHVRHAGHIQILKISVDGHALRVVATDGCEIQPVTVDYLFVTSGEGYTFELDATQPLDKYWIRVGGGRLSSTPGAETGVMTYLSEEEDDGADPTSEPRTCDVDNPCTALNCQPGGFPPEDHTLCIDVLQLTALKDNSPLFTPPPGEDVVEYFANFGYVSGATINGIKHVSPTGVVSAETGLTYEACEANCGQNQPCACFNHLQLPFNKTIQIVISNYDLHEEATLSVSHTIHLHGFNFAVMAAGYPTINAATGEVVQANLDLDCVDTNCMQPRWRSGPPTLKYDHPVEKDTVPVPALGYVVIRFRSDNPGLWLMHCHVRAHSGDGMTIALMTSSATESWDTSYLPTCVPASSSADNSGLQGEDDGDEKVKLSQGEFVGIIVGAVLVGGLLTLVAVVIYAAVTYRKSDYDTRTYDNTAYVRS